MPAVSAPCLPWSLALGWCLQREGISTERGLGGRKEEARLEAHAWVEHGGVPLLETQSVHDRFAAFDEAVAPRSSNLR